MTGRLDRFRLLERARAARGGGADRPAGSAERMKGVEGPGAEPGGEAVAEGHLDRFRPAPERPLELDERGDDAQPFVRCMRCETDLGRGTAVCSTCGADLDNDEQRAFNERLWEARRSERRTEEAALAALESERRVQSEVDARAREAMGETLAREVGELERRRLDAEMRSAGGPFGGWQGLGGGDATPLLLKLLRALPGWRSQAAAIVAMVAIVGALFAWGGEGHPFALLLGAVVAIALLVPRLGSRGDD